MSLRLRLTLVSTLVLAIVLTAFGTGVYLTLNKTLHDNLDQTLTRYTDEIIRFYPNTEAFRSRVDYVAQIVSPGGTEQPIWPPSSVLLPSDERVLSVARGDEPSYYADITVSGVPLRMRVTEVVDGSGRTVAALVVAAPRANIAETLNRLRLLLAWAGVIGLALAAALSWQAAKTALRPVEEVADAATAIGETRDLSRRVDPGGEDELGKLTKAFNGMLDRLESAQTELERTLEGQRRFLADASHEMRTPLTTMRGNLEVIKASPAISPDELKAALTDSIEEAERMSRLIADLLALARADARAQPREERVRLADVVREAVMGAQTADTASGGDGPHVTVDADQSIVVRGSTEGLRRVVTNLVENAMKYTPGDGSVDVSVHREDQWAVLRVADTGLGMTTEEVAHAFDRFWRSDRSRAERGSGLGLAIVKSVVEEHGGAIVAESEPARGTTMWVRLPAEDDSITGALPPEEDSGVRATT
ncbi:MAG TPA: HAMP domain-containing sensor histidine kinase [Actinomycetota bacterium]|nr:HAMP domain-containing sensor histidine kinase [Actinomycetota bacterium]